MFAVREVPQASMGCIPFELVYGHNPRGLLNMVCEGWQDTKSALSKGSWQVTEFRDHTERVRQVARDHFEQSQSCQKESCGKQVRTQGFQVGIKVLVLLPDSTSKLLARWQSPFKITHRVGPVNYEVEQRGQQKIYHIKLLKQWVEPEGSFIDPGQEDLELGPDGEITIEGKE